MEIAREKQTDRERERKRNKERKIERAWNGNS